MLSPCVPQHCYTGSAGGRFLSAARDLNAAAVLDSSRLTPSAQWKVSGHGITNAHHTHKVGGVTTAADSCTCTHQSQPVSPGALLCRPLPQKLAFTVHALWPVHVEAVSAAEQGVTSLAARLGAEVSVWQLQGLTLNPNPKPMPAASITCLQVAAAEAANRSLTAQLQEAARQAARAAAEHDSRVRWGSPSRRSLWWGGGHCAGMLRCLPCALADCVPPLSPPARMQVSQLGKQLGDACAFSSQLAALLEQRDGQVAALREHVAHTKHKHTVMRRRCAGELAGGTAVAARRWWFSAHPRRASAVCC